MPSALETLVKILKLEQDTSYQDKAVIGGLKSFAGHWASEAHAQAKKPEHHALIDELVGLLEDYAEPLEKRPDAIRHMLGRITGRIPPPAGIAPRAIEQPLQQSQQQTQQSQSPTPQTESQSERAVNEPRRDEPRQMREQSPQTRSEPRDQQRPQQQPREERREDKRDDRRDDRRNRDQQQQQDRQQRRQPQQPTSRAVPQAMQEGTDPFNSDDQFLHPAKHHPSRNLGIRIAVMRLVNPANTHAVAAPRIRNAIWKFCGLFMRP